MGAIVGPLTAGALFDHSGSVGLGVLTAKHSKRGAAPLGMDTEESVRLMESTGGGFWRALKHIAVAWRL